MELWTIEPQYLSKATVLRHGTPQRRAGAPKASVQRVTRAATRADVAATPLAGVEEQYVAVFRHVDLPSQYICRCAVL